MSTRLYRVWYDQNEEWPAEGEPEPLGDFEATCPATAAEAAAASSEFDGYHSSPVTMIIRDYAGRYYTSTLELAWTTNGFTALDVSTVREQPAAAARTGDEV